MTLPEVVFVEAPAAASRLAEPGMRQLREASVIALSPWAELELERLGIAFTRPEDHAGIEDVERLGAQVTDELWRWSARVDDFLRARFQPLGDSGLRPAFSCFMWLKIMHDAPAIRALLLQRLGEALRPSRVVYFPTGAGGTDPTLRFMDCSVYGLMIPLWAKVAGVEARAMEPIDWNLHPLAPPRASRPQQAAAGVRWAWRLAKLGAQAGKQRLRGREDSNILVLNPDLGQAVVAHGRFGAIWWRTGAGVAHSLSGLPIPRPVQLSDESSVTSFRRLAPALWRELAADESVRGSFRFGAIDFFPVVESRLRRLVEHFAPACFRDYLTGLQQFERWSVRLLLANNLAYPADASIAQAARASRMPVVVHDHGGMGYFHFPLDRYLDSALADYRLVWGTGVAETVEQRYPEGARPIPVGGLMLDPLLNKTLDVKRAGRRKWCKKLGLDDSSPVVMYVPTSLSGNNRYVSQLHLSDADLFLRSRLIVSVFRDFPNVQLVVKLHPGHEYRTSPIIDLIKRWGMRNCRCVSRGALADMLDVADMFVTDSPTTTLLQMLTTGKRVLIWHLSTMIFEDGALELLKQSAIFASAWDEFEVVLRDHLANRRFQPLDGDRGEFLRCYGTHNGDGRSGERVVQAVRDILGVTISQHMTPRSHTAIDR